MILGGSVSTATEAFCKRKCRLTDTSFNLSSKWKSSAPVFRKYFNIVSDGMSILGSHWRFICDLMKTIFCQRCSTEFSSI